MYRWIYENEPSRLPEPRAYALVKNGLADGPFIKRTPAGPFAR
jgi:hypothetical protein